MKTKHLAVHPQNLGNISENVADRCLTTMNNETVTTARASHCDVSKNDTVNSEINQLASADLFQISIDLKSLTEFDQRN